MAKTIKDMAREVADKFDGDTYDRDVYTDGYTDGANDVLKELRERLKEYKTNSLGEYFVAWDYVNEVIEELKGEE